MLKSILIAVIVICALLTACRPAQIAVGSVNPQSGQQLTGNTTPCDTINDKPVKQDTLASVHNLPGAASPRIHVSNRISARNKESNTHTLSQKFRHKLSHSSIIQPARGISAIRSQFKIQRRSFGVSYLILLLIGLAIAAIIYWLSATYFTADLYAALVFFVCWAIFMGVVLLFYAAVYFWILGGD